MIKSPALLAICRSTESCVQFGDSRDLPDEKLCGVLTQRQRRPSRRHQRCAGRESLRKPRSYDGVPDVVQEENAGMRPRSRTLGRLGGTTEEEKHCPHTEGFLKLRRGGSCSPAMLCTPWTGRSGRRAGPAVVVVHVMLAASAPMVCSRVALCSPLVAAAVLNF
jgi:hypothetical protein